MRLTAILSRMPTLTKYEERITIPVTSDVADRLRAIARAEGEGLAVIVRRAIRNLLTEAECERREELDPR